MRKSFLAGCDFASIAIGEDIEIATVNDVAEYEISCNNSNIGGDIGGDLPNAIFEGFFITDIDTAIPRGEPKETAATSAPED